MAINAGQITLDEAVTIDKRLQTVTRTITDPVHNEVFCLIDPDDADNSAFARIKNVIPATNEYGITVRPLNLNRTASGALGALNAAVTVATEGAGSVTWEIDTGTLSGTVTPEATLDDTNWFAISAIRLDGTIIASTSSFADRGALTSAGYSQVRLRVSAYTSGTSNARVEASHAVAPVVRLGQAIPVGDNAIGRVKLTDGTDVALVTAAGELNVIATAQPSVDIGDVTVNNGAAGAAVNIQDGGNSITVDGTVTANAGTGLGSLAVVGSGTEATALRVTVATDSTGVLSVDDNGGALTVDNGGTFATQDSQVLTDNGAFVDGTSKVFMAGYIYDEVAGTALTENDAAAARVNINRAVVGVIEDGATRARYATVSAANALKVDGSAVTQPVSGTVAVTQSTTPWTVQGQTAHDSAITGDPVRIGGRSSAAAQADVTADGEAVNAWFLRNGAQATVITAAGALIGGDATNGLDVDVTRVSGTVSVQIAAETANRIEVMGDIADDSAAAGNPVQIGVIARNVDRTAVGNADISYATGDLLGKQIVLPYAVPELFVSGLATLTTTSDVSVIGAGGAGVRNYITSLSATNTSGTATRVDFKDGTTTQISFYVAASGGGAAQSFPVPLRGTANTAYQAALSAGVTDVRVSAQGYKAAN